MRTQHIQSFWENDWALTALLLLLSATLFLIAPLSELGYDLSAVGGIVFTLLLLSGVVAVAHTRLTLVTFGSVAVAAAAVHWARYTTWGAHWLAADAVSTLVACGMLAGIVFVQVFRDGPITIRRIQGAIAAYMLIALMFAAIFVCISLVSPGAFSETVPLRQDDLHPTARFAYFSFCTLTTVGYGDIVAVHPFARSMSMLEALIGQLFPAVLLARLVSLEIEDRHQRHGRE